MPSIVAAAYEPYFRKYEQLLTVDQNETAKGLLNNVNKQQRQAALEADEFIKNRDF